MVVKIPMTVEGLKAVKVLSAEGIKTNVTLIFTANQALLAARAGATYVSPFLGRLDDISTAAVSYTHLDVYKRQGYIVQLVGTYRTFRTALFLHRITGNFCPHEEEKRLTLT